MRRFNGRSGIHDSKGEVIHLGIRSNIASELRQKMEKHAHVPEIAKKCTMRFAIIRNIKTGMEAEP